MDNNSVDDSKNKMSFFGYIHHHPIVSLVFAVVLLALTVWFLSGGGKINFFGIEASKSTSQNSSTTTSKSNDTIILPKSSTILKNTTPPTISQKSRNVNSDINVNTGKNNGNIGGENNKVDNRVHQIIGENNGINGDVNILNEHQLSEEDKANLLDEIKRKENELGITIKCFSTILTTTSNGQKVASQIGEFLKSRGYVLQSTGVGAGKPLQGLEFQVDGGCVIIFIGTL